MRLTIDTIQKTLCLEGESSPQTIPLYSPWAFEVISDLWLKVGWDLKYSYSFTWLGQPIIQLPEDVLRIQEVIYRLKPDLIIETGVAHGGSLLLSATLCQALGKGRVIGIDIQIRPQNRAALERHQLAPRLTLLEGSSTAPEILAQVTSRVRPGERVLVILDSCHTREHVRQELEAYHALVTPGSYLVATDGIMESLSDLAAGQADWTWNNPRQAALEFVRQHPEFCLEQPPWLFNDSGLTRNVTYWPGAFLKRIIPPV